MTETLRSVALDGPAASEGGIDRHVPAERMAGRGPESSAPSERAADAHRRRAPAERPHVVLVGQVPPPTHGQAIANRYLVEGRYDGVRLHLVPMRFSVDLADVGRFRWGKVLHLVDVVVRLWWLALRRRRDVLVMSLGLRNRLPLLRDAAILLLSRPFYRVTVLHVHSGGWGEQLDRLPRPVRRVVERAYGGAGLVIYLDESLRDDALSDQGQVAYLPCGVEDPRPEASGGARAMPLGSCGSPTPAVSVGSSGPDDDRLPVVLFLGNLFEAKGTHVLVRAATVLRERGVRCRVVLAGPSPSTDEQVRLDRLIAELDVGDRVKLVGPVDGAAKDRALAEASVFCFPTHFEAEAMPLVVLEAMANALPVVSTTWRGIPSQVVEGVTGYLVEPEDVDALADRLQRLLEDPALARELGRRGRERFEARFEVGRFRRGFEQLVLDALATRRGSSRRDARRPDPVAVEG